MNPEYEKMKIKPFNIWIRDEIGELVKVDQVKKIDKVVENMLKSKKKYEKKIESIVDEYVYNLGDSAEVEAKYIIESLQEHIKKGKENK
jgi:hypothetical protein